MAGRNTMLEVGAIHVPVSMEKISTRSDVKIDRASPNGNKIKRVEIDSVTGETVPSDQVKQGVYDNPKDGTGFREIPKEALDAIEAETEIDAFEIEHFVPVKDLPLNRSHAAYYLRPQKGVTPKPLKLLHEALRKTKKAGVFKLCLTKRQYLGVVYAEGGGLIVNLLHFAPDFKKVADAGAALEGVEANPKHVALATELIESMSADPEVIDSFEDDLIPLKLALVDQALAGKKLTPKQKKAPVKVENDDLAAQLEASVEAAQKRKSSSTKAKAAVTA